MTKSRRLHLALALLGFGAILHLGLAWHLRAEVRPYPEIKGPLGRLPLELTSNSPNGAVVWKGRNNPDLDRSQFPYPVEELVHRLYNGNDPSLYLELFAIYSRTGEDRKHHPEVCLRDVGGAPEDLAGRRLVFLDPDHQRPAQRFRFRTASSQYTTVYYWHYTLPLELREGQSWLQVLHQRMNRAGPSITLLVSTTRSGEQLDAIEASFLPQVDRYFREHCLPPGSAVGCQRLSIGVVRQ